MKIEFTVPFRRVPSPLALVVEPAPDPQSNPPRIARLLALAHKLDALVRSGAVTGYAELARLGHISPWHALRKSWFYCIWLRRSRNTSCFSPQVTPASSANRACARSRGSRAGIASTSFSSSISRNEGAGEHMAMPQVRRFLSTFGAT